MIVRGWGGGLLHWQQYWYPLRQPGYQGWRRPPVRQRPRWRSCRCRQWRRPCDNCYGTGCSWRAPAGRRSPQRGRKISVRPPCSRSEVITARVKDKHFCHGKTRSSTSKEILLKIIHFLWSEDCCFNNPGTHYVLLSRFSKDSLRPSLEMVFMTL